MTDQTKEEGVGTGPAPFTKALLQMRRGGLHTELSEAVHEAANAAMDLGKKATITLQSGEVKFNYTEEVTARAGGKGEIDVPTTFLLKIAPFIGDAAYEVEARFRYRVAASGLKLGYKLVRPERIVDDALAQIRERLREEFEADAGSDSPVFIGTPAAAVTAAR